MDLEAYKRTHMRISDFKRPNLKSSPLGLKDFSTIFARYGSTSGGTPHHHSANNYVAWCQQLGGVYESHTVGTKTGYQLFWCCNYDENKWKWCDWLDGKWYNSPLGYHRTSGQFVTSITCKKR
jgi:hypothetical protein